MEQVRNVFKDEEGYPAAICRKQEQDCTSSTLFNIVMDLKEKTAKVVLGRPTQPVEEFSLSF